MVQQVCTTWPTSQQHHLTRHLRTYLVSSWVMTMPSFNKQSRIRVTHQISDYVGVCIKKLCNGSYKFTQHAFIDSAIEDVGISNSKTKPVPAKVSLQLHAFKDEPVFDLKFNYVCGGQAQLLGSNYSS
jgi:hypothetical protein